MKHWIEAARVRTLPLSISGIIVGSFYAMSQGIFNWKIVIFALSTTLGLQILSNFANDYGDGMKGTDNEDRVGPMRSIQSGAISPGAMRFAIFISSFLTLVSAMLLIYFSFKEIRNLLLLSSTLLRLLLLDDGLDDTDGNGLSHVTNGESAEGRVVSE